MTKKIANFFLLLFFFMGFSGYAMPTDEEWDKYVELFQQIWIKKTNDNNRPLSKLPFMGRWVRHSGAQILMYPKYIPVLRSVSSCPSVP
ncbi:MAG: hypothetical protein ACRCYZ_03835 [Alphaproteobacteria bacterium]